MVAVTLQLQRLGDMAARTIVIRSKSTLPRRPRHPRLRRLLEGGA